MLQTYWLLCREHILQVSALLIHCASIKRFMLVASFSWHISLCLYVAVGLMFPPAVCQGDFPRASELPYSPAPLLVGLRNNTWDLQRRPSFPPLLSPLPQLTHSLHHRWGKVWEESHKFSLPPERILQPLSCSSHLWLWTPGGAECCRKAVPMETVQAWTQWQQRIAVEILASWAMLKTQMSGARAVVNL